MGRAENMPCSTGARLGGAGVKENPLLLESRGLLRGEHGACPRRPWGLCSRDGALGTHPTRLRGLKVPFPPPPQLSQALNLWGRRPRKAQSVGEMPLPPFCKDPFKYARNLKRPPPCMAADF